VDRYGPSADALALREEPRRYFNNPEEIKPLVAKMSIAGQVMFFGILIAMRS